MSFNIKSLVGTAATVATSLAQPGGLFGTALSKLKGEADLLPLLQKAAGGAAAPAQQKAADAQPTQEGGKSYADEALTKKLEENKMYLASLLGSDANKVMDKIKSKVEDYVKANPNATPEQVDAEVKKTFNNESLGAKIFKDVIDKMLQETLSRIRESQE
ncbi:hypothetical protein [Pyxidicoccus xibeiensis]|uniref:hypothetical protein n=1 Tax=Pyxidicoccus xibeiensis TaxID=2906759 RepID=UPI0020A727F7|nr:hypothetical protein [Pyxidicoccus xibeiensis]MCP3141408.1 hypothetical protein [Pyxidicoccus xibeiensis]